MSKRTITCDVGTAQCEDETVKCEKKKVKEQIGRASCRERVC